MAGLFPAQGEVVAITAVIVKVEVIITMIMTIISITKQEAQLRRDSM